MKVSLACRWSLWRARLRRHFTKDKTSQRVLSWKPFWKLAATSAPQRWCRNFNFQWKTQQSCDHGIICDSFCMMFMQNWSLSETNTAHVDLFSFLRHNSSFVFKGFKLFIYYLPHLACSPNLCPAPVSSFLRADSVIQTCLQQNMNGNKGSEMSRRISHTCSSEKFQTTKICTDLVFLQGNSSPPPFYFITILIVNSSNCPVLWYNWN